jgi:SlyX protein
MSQTPGQRRPLNDSTESIRRLEEKIAYLERHVTEQDKAMLEMAEDIARLRREMKSWRDQAEARGAGPGSGEGDSMQHERPPHY